MTRSGNVVLHETVQFGHLARRDESKDYLVHQPTGPSATCNLQSHVGPVH